MGRKRRTSTKRVPKLRRVRVVFAFLTLLVGLLVVGQASPASAEAPTVTSITPSGGGLAGGEIVTIKGTDFTGATAVKFDTVDATSFAVISSTRIVAEVPAASAAATAAITVTNADGTNTGGASYKYGAPEIKSVSPGFADPDASSVVVITGSGFTGATAADVLFGTNAALQVWVTSDTQIIATSPINDSTASPAVVVANGVTDVTVTRNSVASTTNDDSKFLFTAGLPTITNLGDTTTEVTGTDGAATGSLMTITGTRLWGVSQVTFDSAKVTNADDIVVASDGNSMTVKVPTRSSGPVDVVVTNAAGDSITNLKTKFNYYSSTAPKITSVSRSVFDKSATTGGGTFLVAGSGFTGVDKDDITVKCASDITPTSATAVSDTSLIVTVVGSGVAESCGLEIANPIDSTLTVTEADSVRYI